MHKYVLLQDFRAFEVSDIKEQSVSYFIQIITFKTCSSFRILNENQIILLTVYAYLNTVNVAIKKHTFHLNFNTVSIWS
jgi:hypothetical protein